MQSDVWPADTIILIGRPFASATTSSLELSPPFVGPISRPRHFSNRQARGRLMGLRKGRIDHHDPGVLRLRGNSVMIVANTPIRLQRFRRL